MSGQPETQGGWLPAGVLPESGRRYEIQDFMGALFTATFDRYESVIEDGDRILVLHFTDRCSFGTNLPIRLREVAE